MAFDGITICNLCSELSSTLLEGKISKIAQPEKDELLFTIKNHSQQYRLLLSANASLPLVYLTGENKVSPMTAPNFCMLLRKYISNGRITAIEQPDFERIINFRIEHLNELGDPAYKTLVIELMGKHSNIILLDEQNKILDSIKRVSIQTSSVREVLPGRDYFIPRTQDKQNPLLIDSDTFYLKCKGKTQSASHFLYSTYTGISPVVANEVCYRSGIDCDILVNELDEDTIVHFYHIFTMILSDIKNQIFSPCIYFQDKEPVEYASIPLQEYETLRVEQYDSISKVLEIFYASKDLYSRMRQKSADLRRIVSTALERNIKKYDLQRKQLIDTEKKDRFKVYGELIHTYGYQLESQAKILTAINYYDQSEVKIPLDEQLTPAQNAQKYFDKYNKLKRTYEALSKLILETEAEINHLDSVSTAIDLATTEDDLLQIKEELIQSGYIKKHVQSKKVKFKSVPLHYETQDGYHIYVGKNNLQNDELTFKFANSKDWWFHAKGIPGSHVIVRTGGQELPDHVFEDAARLAGFYSKGKGNDKVEIDYLQRKDVKKPNGAKPGFVVYYTNYSMTIEPDISNLIKTEG